jgi:hypothetical protein
LFAKPLTGRKFLQTLFCLTRVAGLCLAAGQDGLSYDVFAENVQPDVRAAVLIPQRYQKLVEPLFVRSDVRIGCSRLQLEWWHFL